MGKELPVYGGKCSQCAECLVSTRSSDTNYTWAENSLFMGAIPPIYYEHPPLAITLAFYSSVRTIDIAGVNILGLP
jgi:hypothetical protein